MKGNETGGSAEECAVRTTADAIRVCSWLACALSLALIAGCRTPPAMAQAGQRFIDDVSRLNPTVVADIVALREEHELRQAILDARRRGLKVSIAGLRHSQGGHAFYDGALVLDMTHFNRILELDPERKTIRVQSGVTWGQIQSHVNPHGLAVKVMQSSNIFTVGGSLSVNAHGRDPNFGPIIETVESFRLLTAEGAILNVSRTEEPELFRLVIGGFGLFGVILDVDLTLTDNIIYRKETTLLDYTDYPRFFRDTVRRNPAAGLHYARLSNAPGSYLRQMYATTFVATEPDPASRETLLKLDDNEPVAVPKFFLALSRGAEWGKSVSWFFQKTVVDPPGKEDLYSRNNAMRPAVAFLEYDGTDDTDILQEYYIPVERFVEFTDGLREILERRNVNLLNLTIRYSPENREAFLPYATAEAFAFVLYINQRRSAQGVEAARTWTQELVDLCSRHGGIYYLPYQLYPTREQMARAYPAAQAFFKKKLEYDPGQLFMSRFYAHYALP